MLENDTGNLLIDTHCHLDLENFDNDRDLVVTKARDQGVVAIINPAINLESSRKIVELAHDIEILYAGIGVHPNEGVHLPPDVDHLFMDLASNQSVIAIGEIGLDYHWMKLPSNEQISIFQAQLDLATKLNLPVIIHNREATKDIMAILRNWLSTGNSPLSPAESPAGVLHSFSGDLDTAIEAVRLGIFLGIGGPVTFRNNNILGQIVEEIPLEYIVLETDSPYLAPHPFRGQRNEPGRVRLVAEKIAEIKGITCAEVCATTTHNASRLFRGRIRTNHGQGRNQQKTH
jgi:TatD DNase family protein